MIDCKFMANSIVFLEDCIEVMKRYDDNHFDLAVTDPPYGLDIAKRNSSIGQKKGQGKITKYKCKDWDSAIPNKEYFKELFRVSKEQIIWGGNYFTQHLPPAMGWLVWDKKQPEGVTFAMAELAFCSIKRSVKIFKCNRAEMQNCVSNNFKIGLSKAKIHPTQKPIALYDWIFANYAKTTDKILDTHLGSGSSRIAAHKAGLDFTGCEIDSDYFEAQEKRYQNFISQLRIF
jgi:site-specific DNA-methyltransferase (adenine-specific)